MGEFSLHSYIDGSLGSPKTVFESRSSLCIILPRYSDKQPGIEPLVTQLGTGFKQKRKAVDVAHGSNGNDGGASAAQECGESSVLLHVI
jgi:hypothetical protein